MSLNILDFSLFFMQKLYQQQKPGGSGGGEEGLHYFRGIGNTYSKSPGEKITIKFLFFIYYFLYFSYGESSTVGLIGSRFEFHRWARLGWAGLFWQTAQSNKCVQET